MCTTRQPSGVLLVGSVPLSSAEEVFTRVSAALPGRLQFLPDGEPGIRGNYIGWQLERFPKEAIRKSLGGADAPPRHPGFTQESIKRSQYDTHALESYETFVALRRQNVIPPDVRFQVSLPTPLNSIQGHIRDEYQAQMEPFYERRILESLTTIIDKIPHEDLAIQWDLCFEIMALEYERGRLTDPFFRAHFSPVQDGVLERVERLCAVIPSDVPLGFHLCYGDLFHKHFIEPADTRLLVDLANSIVKRVKRRVNWIHLPVPKDRDDVAYSEPLKDLDIGEDTRLYLGLVHANDEEATRRRIKTAQSVIDRGFGVATECGMGRTPIEELDSILEISRKVTVPYSGSDSA